VSESQPDNIWRKCLDGWIASSDLVTTERQACIYGSTLRQSHTVSGKWLLRKSHLHKTAPEENLEAEAALTQIRTLVDVEYRGLTGDGNVRNDL
jgi:hypothetical protein